MKKPVNIKKIILPNLPYLLFALLGTKCGQAARLAPGLDFSQKALHILDGFRLAFKSLLPSFHPADLLVGLLIAAALRLAVYVKGKNAKKFRKNMEYGSARWGTHEDIAPYIDPVFENNIILTQTESLTMNNRPKDPRTARNKNVLVIGGSGSGKTRFFYQAKPHAMPVERLSGFVRRHRPKRQYRGRVRQTVGEEQLPHQDIQHHQFFQEYAL